MAWWPLPGAAPCGEHSVLVRNHPCDFLVIRFIQNRIGIELALALGCLGSQDVTLKRVTALNLARTRLLKALSRSAMCLQLRHNVFLLQHKTHEFSYSRRLCRLLKWLTFKRRATPALKRWAKLFRLARLNLGYSDFLIDREALSNDRKYLLTAVVALGARARVAAGQHSFPAWAQPAWRPAEL